MSVATYEGVAEGGKIKLEAGISLPEQTKVYVVVPDEIVRTIPRVVTPRLAHPEQIADFQMEIAPSPSDASVRY